MFLNNRWFFLSLVLSLALVSSLAINLVLYIQAQKYYLEVNETRLDPLGLRHYPETRYPETTHSLSEEDRHRIVIVGDSRAAAWTVDSLGTNTHRSHYTIINRGINAQTTAQVLKRFNAHVHPLKPNTVVLQVGINDLKTVALFPSRRDEIVANCQTNIAEIVEQAKRLGATVIITTIFPTGDVPLHRQPFWSEAIAQAVLEVNASIKALADEDVMILDAFSLLADDHDKMKATYQLDELHVNQDAYEILNEALMVRLME